MIKMISLALCLLLGTVTYSQNTSVISNGGGTIDNGTISLDQSIGELVVDDLSGANTTLEQGFQNTFLKIGILFNARVYLQGPYNEDLLLMNDDLRNANYVPEKSPYLDSAMITDLNVLTVTGNDAVVDWVFVEIRDRSSNDIVVDFQSGLLQRDGDIVGVDGITPLRFDLMPGTYYFSVNHRNHLGVLTNTAQLLSGANSVFDFTDGSLQTLGGTNAQWTMNSGDFALIAGDAFQNDDVKITGVDNDFIYMRSSVLNEPGNIFGLATYSFNGYYPQDTNMDGTVKVTGVGNDALVAISNVLNHPSNIFGLRTFVIFQNF